jgi:hypothetical protein
MSTIVTPWTNWIEETKMPGSVPRAINELEALREQVQDPDLLQLIEVLLRLLTGTDLGESARQVAKQVIEKPRE